MNFYVKDTQFFMGMAGEVPLSRSHPPSRVSRRFASAREDHVELRHKSDRYVKRIR